MKFKSVKCKSGLTGSQYKLKDNYDNNFSQFEHFNELYNISGRLGFKNAKQLWDLNPLIWSSVNPDDLEVVNKDN